MYLDNQNKFVAVLNRKHPTPVLMNALGHITAGLVVNVPDSNEAFRFLDYRNTAAGMQAKISHYPYIVLSGDNSNQIRTTLCKAVDQGVQNNVFVSSMLGYSAEEQMSKTREAKAEELEYIALVLFGNAAQIDSLTKRFSLYKNASNESKSQSESR